MIVLHAWCMIFAGTLLLYGLIYAGYLYLRALVAKAESAGNRNNINPS